MKLFVAYIFCALCFVGCGKHLTKTLPKTEENLKGTTFSKAEIVLNAVKTGDLDGLAAALEEGFDANHTYKNGRTLLMEAAIVGNSSIVKLLLDSGADKDLLDSQGQTAADLASTAAIRDLLSGGLGEALLEAARTSNAQALQQALDTGADINYQDESGTSALMIIAQNGNAVLLRAVIRYSQIDYNLRNGEGKTAYTLALEAGQDRIAKFIESRGGSA